MMCAAVRYNSFSRRYAQSTSNIEGDDNSIADEALLAGYYISDILMVTLSRLNKPELW